MEMINKWQERNAKLTEEINSPWAQQEYLKAELKFQFWWLEAFWREEDILEYKYNPLNKMLVFLHILLTHLLINPILKF